MPPRTRTPVQVPTLSNPFTGKALRAPKEQQPQVLAPSPLDVGLRQAEVARARSERGAASATLLRREHDKYAHDPSAHPLRRFRLRYPTGALSIEDLEALSGVSARTIKRIEKNDDKYRPIESVWAALAAALIDPSSGRPVRPDQLHGGHA